MNYKSVYQYDSSDCASACIASVSWYFGKKVPLAKLQQYTNMNKNGSSVLDILDACKKIGITANAAKKADDFNENIISVPCIAHVNLEDGTGHFIVIYKIKKEKIVISDPAIGLISIDKKDFFNSVYSENSPYIWSGILIFLIPGKNFRVINEKEKKQNVFLNLILSEKKMALDIVGLSAISMILTIINAFYFKIIVDILIPNRWGYSLILVTFLFSTVSLIKVLINKIRVRRALNISKSINLKLSLDYYLKILRLPITLLDKRQSGDLLSRFQDASKVQEILVTSILILPIDIILIVVVGIILSLKSLKLFLLVLLMSLSYFLVMTLFKKDYLVYNSKQMIAQAKMTSHLVDSLDGIETIKTYCQEENFYIQGKDKLTKWQNLLVKLGNIENNQAVLKTIINSIGELIIICVGSFEVINGHITIGDLITYNILISYILAPISDIVNIQPQFHTSQIAMERLDAIMQSTIENRSGNELDTFNKIVFSNVEFGFEQNIKVLRGADFEIYKGQKVAIVGSSGSGKTTIAKLLMKFHSAEAGNIYINGDDIISISTESIRSNIVYVSQEDFIFSGSIKENLKFGNETISDETMLNMAKIFGIHDFVKDLPKLYDSILEEKGANLSKGQKQKIALMRAILRKPKVLILDEATSNMDLMSENKILNELKAKKDLTLIIITHRIDSILDSDCIYVMKEGYILARGNHTELLNNCLEYKKSYNN